MANKQYVTFQLDHDWFGIDILFVREINRNINITPIDLAPPYIKGLLNLRGQVVTVFDLAERLELKRNSPAENKNCIILKTNKELREIHTTEDTLELENINSSNDTVGFLVDSIGDIINTTDDMLEAPPIHIKNNYGAYIEGVVKLEDRLLIPLNVSSILLLESTLSE